METMAIQWLPIRVNGIPTDMKAMDQWVGWRAELRNGKWTKPPVNPCSGKYADCTDPCTWGSFRDAMSAYQRRRVTGIGFVFSVQDPFTGIDLDKCRDPKTHAVERWAQTIVSDLASYAEISPSGTGIHIIVRGCAPLG